MYKFFFVFGYKQSSLPISLLSLLCCLFFPGSSWRFSIACQFSCRSFPDSLSQHHMACFLYHVYYLAIVMIIMLPNKLSLNSVAYYSKHLFSCSPVHRFSVFSLLRLGLAEWLDCSMNLDLLHMCSFCCSG